jgi:ABC-type branched-subunit amino acid transport system substrate-binding protein
MRQSRFPHWRGVLAVLLSFAFLAAACSSSDDGTESSTPAPVDTSADSTPPTDTGDTAAPVESTPATEPAATVEPTTPPEPAGPPEATNGFDGETITLGYLTDQSGTLAIVGNSLLAGSQVYWDWVNSQGGIAGMYPVELKVGDTQDSEAKTVQEYQRIKDDVVMLAEVLSTPPVQALLEFLDEDGIIAVPGSLAGQWANEPLLLPSGSSYQSEMINLADWYVNESGLSSADDVFCAIRTNDKYGVDTIEGVRFAADRLGFDIAEEQTHSRGDTAFTAQITAFDDAGCDVVFGIAVAFEMHSILTEANAQGFEPVWLGALPSYVNLLAAGSPELYTNLYVALDTPNFTDNDVPGMAKFNERWTEFGSGNPNTFNLSGYFQSIAIQALLEKAVANGDLGREGLQTALAGLGEVDVEGLADNYVYGTPENRIPSRAVRIFRFDPNSPPNLLTELTRMDSPLTADFMP